jgi:hypothetical protein
MAMVDEDVFGGRPLARIFLAPTVSEARRVEAVFDQHGIDYCVRVEPCGRTLFGSTRMGAAFFVDDTQSDSCEAVLIQAGLGAGIVRDVDQGGGPKGL